jgi:hypothetical protein
MQKCLLPGGPKKVGKLPELESNEELLGDRFPNSIRGCDAVNSRIRANALLLAGKSANATMQL